MHVDARLNSVCFTAYNRVAEDISCGKTRKDWLAFMLHNGKPCKTTDGDIPNQKVNINRAYWAALVKLFCRESRWPDTSKCFFPWIINDTCCLMPLCNSMGDRSKAAVITTMHIFSTLPWPMWVTQANLTCWRMPSSSGEICYPLH